MNSAFNTFQIWPKEIGSELYILGMAHSLHFLFFKIIANMVMDPDTIFAVLGISFFKFPT